MHVQTDGQDATRSHTMQACPDDLVTGASSIARVLETVQSVLGGNSSLFLTVITLYRYSRLGTNDDMRSYDNFTTSLAV